jgi:hypothetical protein
MFEKSAMTKGTIQDALKVMSCLYQATLNRLFLFQHHFLFSSLANAEIADVINAMEPVQKSIDEVCSRFRITQSAF